MTIRKIRRGPPIYKRDSIYIENDNFKQELQKIISDKVLNLTNANIVEEWAYYNLLGNQNDTDICMGYSDDDARKDAISSARYVAKRLHFHQFLSKHLHYRYAKLGII